MSLQIDLNNLPILLRFNQQYLGRELLSRGAQLTLLDKPRQILLAEWGGRQELFHEINSRLMPHVWMEVCSNKHLCLQVMANNGFSVPRGGKFKLQDLDQMLSFAYEVDFPVVLKPNFGTQGYLVFAAIESAAELYQACLHASSLVADDSDFLLESKFCGDEYRVLLLTTGQFAVLRRDPPKIIGDGVSSIKDLVAKESERRASDFSNCLRPILLDFVAESYLQQQGLSVHSVLKEGQEVCVRPNSNLYTGGFATDVTSEIHPEYISMLMNLFKVFPNLPYVGVDLMTKSISQYLSEHVILELNTMPAIGPHHAPAAGMAHNVAGWLVDLLEG